MIASFKTKYREYAEAHGKATLSGNYRTANRCHDKLIALLQKIRACGHAGEAVLLELTEDSDDAVRCWAATHTLCFNESRALVTLEKLSRKPGLIGFDAQMVIEQWKKGKLRV